MTPPELSKAWAAVNAASLVAVKILVVVLVGALVYDYFHEGIVIRPISVPSALRDEGVTDAVAADELRQRIYGIRQRASYNQSARMPAALSADQPDIDVPTTGISMNTVFDILARVLPFNTRTVISGDFTADSDQLRLVVLLNGRQVYENRSRRSTLASADQLLSEAARAVVTSAHPDWEALALDHAGDPRAADELMQGVISKAGTTGPDVAEAHLLRGMFLRDELKYHEACAEFNASLALSPENVDAHQGLAALLEDEGQYDAATAEAQKAVIFSWGRNSWAYYALGTSYYQGGKLADADRAFAQAIQLWPGNSSAHDALGYVKHGEGDDHAALSEYGRAIALDGSFVDARDDRGSLLINRFRSNPDALEEARDDFELARQQSPKATAPELGLGHVNYWTRKYAAAEKDFLAVLQRAPSIDVARDAYEGAINSIDREPWAARDVEAQRDLSLLDAPQACPRAVAIPAVVAGHTILHTLGRMRCSMEVRSRRSLPTRSSKCEVNADRVAMLPSEIMFYSFGMADGIARHQHQVAASIALVAFAGFALLGWQKLHRAVKPSDPETASDTDARKGRRGPKA